MKTGGLMMQSKIAVVFLLATCVASCFAASCLLEEGCSAESYICEGIHDLEPLNTIPETAQRITIFNSKLQSLPTSAFSRFAAYLVYLNISSSELSEIKPGAFSGLTTLRELVLDNNQIESIKAEWIAGLSSLKTLRVWHNHITEIKPEVFDHLPHLELLDIAYNKIDKCIPEKLLAKLGELDILYLAGNPWPLRCRPPVIFHLEDHHVQVVSDWGDSHILIAECLAHEPYAQYNDDILDKCYTKLAHNLPYSHHLHPSTPKPVPVTPKP